MKIYQPGMRGKVPHFVRPGIEFPVSHFLDESGQAKMFTVTFVNGEADVEDTLGQYMIDKGEAKSSPIILL
jgi:hypothetical protein